MSTTQSGLDILTNFRHRDRGLIIETGEYSNTEITVCEKTETEE